MKLTRLMLAFLGMVVGACEVGSDDAVTETTGALASSARSRWVALGDDVSPDPAAYLSRPSLVTAPVRPIVAFSSLDIASSVDTTTVLRWTAGAWEQLGAFGGTAPVIAADGRNRPLVCYGSGPFVKRWNGSRWIDMGGDISSETGYRGTRYQVEGCQGMVFNSDGAPIVAWSADVGAKANLVFVARWSRHDGRWLGVGDGAVGPRATSAAIAIGQHDRLVAATFTPGGSYGGGNTTRAFRWDGTAWTQLGADMPGTSEPTAAIHGNRTYLAFGVTRPDLPPAVTVMQWRDDAWQVIAPTLPGDGPTVAFTPSGRLVLAYRTFEGAAGEPERSALRVVRLARGEWHAVGDELADVTMKTAWQAIAVDALGRPVVAWREQDDATQVSALAVRRFSDTLP